MAKAHMHYQALLNERSTAVISTSLKVTSGASGFKVMDPFDWTKDKAIYQRWQMWSEISGEFHAHVVKIVKRCRFPCTKAEERAIRDTIFFGMNSTQARDKAINLMNEEGKELTVEFLIQQLEIEDCNSHHKSLSKLDSTLLHMTVDRTRQEQQIKMN